MPHTGISVVISCHNGTKRLPDTLQHLLIQRIPPGVPWEVVVVDNASKDNVRGVVKQYWPENGPCSIVVVNEPRFGLVRARTKGILVALYDYVVFIDDNHWLDPDWIRTAYEIMSSNADLVACGGINEAFSESKLPEWFPKNVFAVGSQAEKTGPISEDRGFLWGAGLMVLKSAYEQLIAAGFGWRLTSRYRHDILQSGVDEELTRALALTGKKLWYDERLKLKCFIAPDKIKWDYVKKLFFGYGEASDIFDAYRFAAQKEPKKLSIWNRFWGLRALSILWEMILKHHFRLIRYCFFSSEGDPELLDFEYQLGQLTAVLQLKNEYDRNFHEIEKLRNKVFHHDLSLSTAPSLLR